MSRVQSSRISMKRGTWWFVHEHRSIFLRRRLIYCHFSRGWCALSSYVSYNNPLFSSLHHFQVTHQKLIFAKDNREYFYFISMKNNQFIVLLFLFDAIVESWINFFLKFFPFEERTSICHCKINLFFFFFYYDFVSNCRIYPRCRGWRRGFN